MERRRDEKSTDSQSGIIRETTKTDAEILPFFVSLGPPLSTRPAELCQKGKLVILSKVCPPRLRYARNMEEEGDGDAGEGEREIEKGKGRTVGEIARF